MKAGSFAVFAPAMLLASVSLAGAQQLPPRAAADAAGGSAAARAGRAQRAGSVRGLHPGPRDLYQSPDGSDRFQHLSPLSCARPPIVFLPGVYFPGPYYYPGRSVRYETSMAETYRMSMAETYLRRQREAARGGLVLTDRARHGAGLRRWILRGARRGVRAAWTSDQFGRRRAPRRAARAGYETLTFSVDDRTERHRALSRRDAVERDEAGCRRHHAAAADRCDTQLLRHSQLLRRRQAADRNAAQGLQSKKSANPEVEPRLDIHSRNLYTNSALPAAIATCCLPFTA